VTQPIVEMAKAATSLLLNLLEDPEAILLEVLPPNLMIRQSTAPLRSRQAGGRKGTARKQV
jgi:DNA-binding LacI/PurR family transcriptional regulator